MNDGSKLFEPEHAPFYTRPFAALRDYCAVHGVALYASEDISCERVDILICVDLPNRKKELDVFFRRYSHASKILLVHESPIRWPEFLNQDVHGLFDAVITYDRSLLGPSIIAYGIPVLPDHSHIERGPSFKERQLAVTIATNYALGTLGWRRWAATAKLRGWPIELSTLFDSRARADGYAVRRDMAVAAERLELETKDFSIYGSGWSGEARNRWERIIGPRAYRAAHGLLPPGSTHETLLQTCGRFRFYIAVENYIGHHGYVSEKLFHGLLSGAVPVYLGDSNIRDWLPPGSFVDARVFSDWEQMFSYLKSVDESQWNAMVEAGREATLGPGRERYGYMQFGKAVVDSIELCCNRRHS